MDNKKVILNDCVKEAARLLQIENGLKETDELADCVNFVISQIACEMISLKCTEGLEATNGVINYAAFSKKPIGIFAVKSGRTDIPFYAGINGVEVKTDGLYNIEYEFEPSVLTLTDAIPFEGSNVTARVIAMGAAAEYCLINGMAGEASLWDKRFKDAVYAVRNGGKPRKIKPRRWY